MATGADPLYSWRIKSFYKKKDGPFWAVNETANEINTS